MEVGTHQGARNSFWKDMGYNCDTAKNADQFLEEFGWGCDAAENETFVPSPAFFFGEWKDGYWG